MCTHTSPHLPSSSHLTDHTLEPSSLEQLSTSPDTSIVALRLIDFFTVPKANGDCVVLLVAHPGLNLLGRYFPPSKVNDLLLADVVRTRPSSVPADIYMMGTEEPAMFEEMDPMDVMDLASFLEYVRTTYIPLPLSRSFSQICNSSNSLSGDDTPVCIFSPLYHCPHCSRQARN